MYKNKDKGNNNNIVSPTDDAEIVAPSERVTKIMELVKDCNFMEFNSLVVQLAKLQGISQPGKLIEKAIETQMSFSSMAMMGTGAAQMPAGAQPAAAAPAGDAPAGGAPAGGAPAGGAPAKPDKGGKDAKGGKGGRKKKSKYKITLISYDEKDKFGVIKIVRQVKKGMNLMDSKALTEELPKVINDAVEGEDIEEFKEKFAAIPAVIEVVEN